MRIGTWNLAGTWTSSHAQILQVGACDVWLLTEVPADATLEGYYGHVTEHRMDPGQHWAGVFSRDRPLVMPDPHPASAAVELGGHVFCASVLPWRSCGTDHPWVGSSQGEKTARTIEALASALPARRTVWGGDWNHALCGPNHGGSALGRTVITALAGTLGLKVATARLFHRTERMCSIDHVAFPERWTTNEALRIPVPDPLSDHDVYIVDVHIT
ncbi:MAG: hypothetical protein QOH56_1653 [Pseudonocardiales bacterium]|jgi:hypothetical protein|nr:hypothetical protein [Pseudonocardiales bacterium]